MKTLLLIACVVLSQFGLVAGQVFLKHSMNMLDRVPRSRALVATNLTAGISLLTLWFFLWIGLLQQWDLSYVYPFEGISPVLLILAAWLLLNEKMTTSTWVGVGLISLGMALVGLS